MAYLRLNLHDQRDFIQPLEHGNYSWENPPAGITIYNDPIEITFRKDDSEIRKDLVITLDDKGEWVACFYKRDKLVDTVKI